MNIVRRESEDYHLGRLGTIRYIVIHDLGHMVLQGGGINKHSIHFWVNETGISDYIEERNTAFHCETSIGYLHPYCRNYNSIGILMMADNVAALSEKLLFHLTKVTGLLMRKYAIPSENVLRHGDVTGRICPVSLNNNTWRDFKEGLEKFKK